MAKMSKKDYSVMINVDTVKNASISRYSDGYNYASISSKMADNEFMSVHYEWKGKQIPEFALSVMEIMKSLGKEEKASLEQAEAIERASKLLSDQAAKMKKEMKDDPDMEDEEDDDMKKKKGKKKKDC